MTFTQVMRAVGAIERYGSYYMIGIDRNDPRPQRIAGRHGRTAVYTTCTLPLRKNPICDGDFAQQLCWVLK